MTNEEILKKAIEKAEENGFSTINRNPINNKWEYYPIIFSHDFAKAFWGEEERKPGKIQHDVNDEQAWEDVGFRLIRCKRCHQTYNYKFDDIDECMVIEVKEGWKYHLQQCVLCDNPLEYIKKFL